MFRDPKELKTIHGLDVLEVGDRSHENCVVLFHGYGANAFDLKPLGELFVQNNPARWLFPDGLMEVPLGPGFIGRAWFPIDESAHQRAAATGHPVDYSNSYPPGLSEARKMADRFVSKIRAEHKKLIIGGFSQGAMLSTDITLSHPEWVDGLMAISGTLLDEDRWKAKVKNCKGIPFFQSHGRKDLILPYDGAVGLEKLLLSGGMQGHLLSFDGGHEIPHQVLVSIGLFLQRVFSS